jgi:hypothetical protein
MMVGVLMIALVALKPTSGDDCDKIKLSKRWDNLNYMQTWPRAGIAGSPYTFILLTSEKKIQITYGDLKILLNYDPSSDARVVTSQDDFFEIIIVGKEKKSFLFYKGIEIRTLIPKINEKDNFRSKPDGEEIVFYFNDSDYGVYNIQNKTFCRTKN